jgi:hypothetical protein
VKIPCEAAVGNNDVLFWIEAELPTPHAVTVVSPVTKE